MEVEDHSLQERDQGEVLISLHDVGKVYHLFNKPVDRLKYTLFWRFGRTYGREFWALRDINFDVRRGEAVGIMGRNGSGKSTLLQIIAGVLQPSTGEVTVKGRVSALLELGSGFNPEYTGRQNVYLSGAILGISSKEMNERFDDIAAFADIGEFIDQPVKLYSSGMFARLAFSVAIAVDPDILVVDEILSVGDSEFQQKCAVRMRRMRDDGLTLFYVSHSTDSIKDICDKGIFLHDGQSVFWGSAQAATERYLQFIRERKWVKPAGMPQQRVISLTEQSTTPGSLRYGRGDAHIVDVKITDDEDNPAGEFYYGEKIRIHIRFEAFVEIQHFSVNFTIRDNNGITVMGTNLFDERIYLPNLMPGDKGEVIFEFSNQLHHGNYGVNVSLNTVSDRDYLDNVELDWIAVAATFQVLHNPERPVWYKFHSPVEVKYEILPDVTKH